MLGDHGGNQTNEVDKTATTMFVDDSISVLTTLPMALSGVSTLSVPPVSDPRLAQFLAKPYIVDQVNWTSATAADSQLTTYNTISALGVDVFASKIKGYRLFRATLCIKVTINAQPFQAGRLLCHFLPYAENQARGYPGGHSVDLTTKTQQPNFELDCRDASGSIEIPWTGPAPWIDVVNTSVSWGRFYITVLSPLLTGTSGSTGVEVTTLIYFKDAEFAGPLMPQSGDKPRIRRVTKVSAEAEAATNGKPISTMMNAASRVATIAKGVPLLSSIATPAEWILRAGADIASAFGYSKPNLANTCQFMNTRPLHNMANCDGPSYGEPLALTSNPCISPLPGFGGSSIDEMSFAYLKSVPAYVHHFTFNTTDSAGDTIYNKFVGPTELMNTGTNGLTTPNLATYATMPPFSYVSRAFHYWKGSIHLLIKFVKTDFHSGRVMVVWSPTDNNSATDVTTAGSAYSMRTIVDIREVTEIDIELPYMLPRCWQTMSLGMGKVQVIVLNTLQYPATVGSTIDALCYYYAGSDFDLAYPANNQTLIPYSPQSGDKPNTKVAGVIGNDSTHVTMIEEHTIGEKFTSVKQLINRYSRVYVNSGTTSIFDTANSFRMYPWAIGCFVGNVSSAVSYFAYGGDMYSFIAAGYALCRGGMRYSINLNGSAMCAFDYSYADYLGLVNSGTLLECSTATLPNTLHRTSGSSKSTYVPPNYNADTGTFPSGNQAVFVQSTNGVEVLIPGYAMNPSRLIPWSSSPLHNISADYTEAEVSFGCLSFDATAAPTYKKLYRAAADDHQLGYFVGFPAMLVDTT